MPSKASWRELFKYPRSLAAGILTGQTGGVGLALRGVTLIALVLKVSPAQASFLVIWTALIGIVGRVFGSWISDALGRRAAGTVLSLGAALTVSLARYLHNVYLGTASVFYILLLIHSFFANGGFSIVFPYMAELWPASLRASGFGLVYGRVQSATALGPREPYRHAR